MHTHRGYSKIQNRVCLFLFPVLFLTLLFLQLCYESAMSAYGGGQHSAPVPGLVGQTVKVVEDNVAPKLY